MNLRRSSVQIVHSSGKFRAVVLSSSFNLVLSGGFCFSKFGLDFFYRRHTNISDAALSLRIPGRSPASVPPSFSFCPFPLYHS